MEKAFKQITAETIKTKLLQATQSGRKKHAPKPKKKYNHVMDETWHPSSDDTEDEESVFPKYRVFSCPFISDLEDTLADTVVNSEDSLNLEDEVLEDEDMAETSAEVRFVKKHNMEEEEVDESVIQATQSGRKKRTKRKKKYDEMNETWKPNAKIVIGFVKTYFLSSRKPKNTTGLASGFLKFLQENYKQTKASGLLTHGQAMQKLRNKYSGR
ncbi:unnamed protein product [Diamesa hyperborea]